MAVNGVEALQLLSSFEPDLILLDMKMPGMNGIETLEKIRALNRRATVIMMTGNDDPRNMEQAKDLEIQCYITKPFDLFKLKEQVSEILNTQNLSVR